MIVDYDMNDSELWFDVEKRYKTIRPYAYGKKTKLWFDVEKRYKTMRAAYRTPSRSCGLM